MFKKTPENPAKPVSPGDMYTDIGGSGTLEAIWTLTNRADKHIVENTWSRTP